MVNADNIQSYDSIKGGIVRLPSNGFNHKDTKKASLHYDINQAVLASMKNDESSSK